MAYVLCIAPSLPRLYKFSLGFLSTFSWHLSSIASLRETCPLSADLTVLLKLEEMAYTVPFGAFVEVWEGVKDGLAMRPENGLVTKAVQRVQARPHVKLLVSKYFSYFKKSNKLLKKANLTFHVRLGTVEDLS